LISLKKNQTAFGESREYPTVMSGLVSVDGISQLVRF
jgi:hypothetical protein